ncbi:sensor domain-containing protein [uncultured Mycobacterium sp.]|uniref:sensor domain-containing protein n=1 Tax=uncultured Mycobacterium sp. TaxID=171292 RepID=UPI0035CB7F8A
MTAGVGWIRKPAVLMAGLGVIAATTTAPANCAPLGPGTTSRPGATMLLDRQQMAAVTGAVQMTVVTGPHPGLDDASGALDAPHCAGVWAPAQKQAYAGSGWESATAEAAADSPADTVTHTLDQAVVSFPSPAAAGSYLLRAAAGWAGCAGKPLTYTEPGHAPQTWLIGKPLIVKDKTAVAISRRLAGQRWSCQRATGAYANLIIDVMACGADPTGQALDALVAITANIGQPV